jgi:hypothetical protein
MPLGLKISWGKLAATAVRCMRPDWRGLFHRLWSRAVGYSGYYKDEWRELESILLEITIVHSAKLTSLSGDRANLLSARTIIDSSQRVKETMSSSGTNGGVLPLSARHRMTAITRRDAVWAAYTESLVFIAASAMILYVWLRLLLG